MIKNKVLAKLHSEFAGFRKRERRLRAPYPQSLQDLVVWACEEGVDIKEIIQAAGISKTAAYKWRREGRFLPPRELRVVSSASIEGKAQSLPDILSPEVPLARMRFQSQVKIDLPVSSLSIDLLQSLNQLGGVTC